MTSQPLSSATSVGALKGKVRSTPFSVPIQRALCATATVDIWIGMWEDRFSLPKTECIQREGEMNDHMDVWLISKQNGHSSCNHTVTVIVYHRSIWSIKSACRGFRLVACYCNFSQAISSACGAISSINAHHTQLVKLFSSNLVCAKIILHKYFFNKNSLDEKKANYGIKLISNWQCVQIGKGSIKE